MQSLSSDDDANRPPPQFTPIRVFFALLVTYTIIGVLLLIIFTPSFMVNDDVTMASIINGDYTGRPLTDLVFIGRLAAVPLFILNKFFAAIPWYTLFVTWGSFVGLSLIGATIFARRKKTSSPAFIVYFAGSVLVLPTITLEVTFTVTAFILATAGVLLMITAANKAFDRKPILFLAFVVLLFAASIRQEAAVAVLVLAFPIFVKSFLKSNLKAIGIAIALIFGVFSFNFLLNNFTESSEWKTFDSFNETRGLLHGNQRFESLAVNMFVGDSASLQTVESIRWTYDEIANFWAWNFDAPEIFTSERLKELSSAVGQEPRISVFDAVREVTHTRHYQIIYVILVTFQALILCHKRERISILLTSIWASAVFIWTATYQRFPDRVAIPMFFVVTVLVCFEASKQQLNFFNWGRPKEFYVNKILIVLLVSLAFINLTFGNSSISSNAASGRSTFRRQIYNEQLDQLKSIDPTGRFVYVGASIAAEGINPYSPQTSFDGDFLLGLGWPTFSPIYEARKKMIGIDGNLVASLVEGENLYYVTQPTFVETTTRLFSRIYGVPLKLELVGGMTSGAGIYIIRTI